METLKHGLTEDKKYMLFPLNMYGSRPYINLSPCMLVKNSLGSVPFKFHCKHFQLCIEV
jgi:hypothetical protein